MFTGEIRLFGAAPADARWLACNGQVISRTTFATLFGIIGTTFGTGDGSTTFNVPALQGRCPMVAGDSGDGTVRILGGTAGANNVTLSVSQLAGHTHDYAQPSNAQGVQAGGDFTAFTDTASTPTGSSGDGALVETTSPVLVVLAYIWSAATT